jgi:hypothetical protein
MSRDINARLSALQARRRGIDRLGRVAMDSQTAVAAKSVLPESYQKRAVGKTHTQYALGAMQEVDADDTRISLETAERVGKQLDQGLTASGNPVTFMLQGSVPLNVHIRGVSDVDLLTLDSGFITYAVDGKRSRMGLYTSPTPKTSVGVLSTIRTGAARILREKYYAADIDTSGSKAIKISGGSLARPVDVVPAHWNDNVRYQETQNANERGVTILDSKAKQTINNLPFLHIALISAKDRETHGGLKKAIRLCKNVRSDAEHDIALPSFDIAALMYHADTNALSAGSVYELNILAEAQRYLDFLHFNKQHAKSLKTPDGLRCILDSEEKLAALTLLSIEMDDLLRQVAKEQSSALAQDGLPPLDKSRSVLESLYIP